MADGGQNTVTRISTVEELIAAVEYGGEHQARLCLLPEGSPYRLSEPLRLARDVIVFGWQQGEGGSTRVGPGERSSSSSSSSRSTTTTTTSSDRQPKHVTIVGTITLSDGAALHALRVEPPPPRAGPVYLHTAATAAGSNPVPSLPTVEILPSLRRGSHAWLHDVDIEAPAVVPPTANAAALPVVAAGPPVALRICSATSARVTFCQIRGAVVVCERAAPLLQSNVLLESDGAGVELRATRGGCELRDNTIRMSRGSGVLLLAKARATLADNRLERCTGPSIEVAAGSAPLVLRNNIEEAGGVGVLVHSGGRGELRENSVKGAWSSAVEVCDEGTDVLLRENRLEDGRTGVGILVRERARARLEGNRVRNHPLAGIEVSTAAHIDAHSNRISGCGCGVLVAPGGDGMFRSNAITDNVRDGVECNSQVQTLTMDGNTISGQRHGAGVVVRAGGAGHWQQNTITGNAVGVEIGAGASPDLVQCKIHGNLREGVHVQDAGRAILRRCQIRSNGNGRLVSHERRGTRTHGDDVGAGVLVDAGGAATLEQNQICMNAGPGVFAHTDARVSLSGNLFNGNRGDALATRPLSDAVLSEADAACTDYKRAVTPSVVRRQRVPFDWTVGANVGDEDKTLAERVAEMRAQYEAMRGDKSSAGSLAMLPLATTDASAVCILQ